MAHTFDVSSYAALTTGAPKTLSHTCGANAKLFVLSIFTAGTTPRTGGAPTFGGKPLTQINVTYSQTETTNEMWYILNPSVSAAYTVSVPNTGTARSNSLTGASYNVSSGWTTQLDSSTIAFSASGANPSTNISASFYGSLIVQNWTSGLNAIGTPTPYLGTPIVRADVGNYGYANLYYITPDAGTYRIGWPAGADDYIITTALFHEYNPSAAPDAPTLVAPIDNTYQAIPIIYEWTPSGAAATSYGIQRASSTNFTAATIDSCIFGITNLYYESILGAGAVGETYYWRANATNANGDSAWTSPWKFTVTFQHEFDASAHSDGLTGNPIIMDYTCGDGATLFALGIGVVGSAIYNPTNTAPTYNGISMSPVDGSAQLNGSVEGWSQLWYLLDPPKGTHTVSVSNPLSRTMSLFGSSFKAIPGYRTIFDASAGINATTGDNPSTNITRISDITGGTGLLIGMLSSGTANVPTVYYPKELDGTHSFGSYDPGAYVYLGLYNRRYLMTGSCSFGAVAGTDDWSLVVGAFVQEPVTYGGILKYYDGGSWSECPSDNLKLYANSTWNTLPEYNFKIYRDDKTPPRWYPIRFNG
jgi:hypothetical protein